MVSRTTPVGGEAAGFAELERATADLDPPFAVVDLGALRANAVELVRRAGGKPIRLATKSVRCRALIRDVLAVPGYRGVLAFTLPEAIWLAEDVDDVVVGYPSADRAALRRLAADERLASRITLMIDSVDQLDLVTSVVGLEGPPLRICLDVDASLRLLGGRVHLGARRSPLHTPAQARDLARDVARRPRFRLVGVMAYEAQIAGVGDNQPGSPLVRAGVRTVQRRSAVELRERRGAVVAAVRCTGSSWPRGG